MANNLPEKKLIDSFRSFSKMPYQKVEHINFSEANNFINVDSLNNAYTQLIDNDLFVAQELKNKIGYRVGPLSSTYADSQEVQEGPNGTKFFNAEVQDGTAIFRKVDFPMQQSIKRISNADLNDVQFMQKVNDQCILACTLSKTFFAEPKLINSDAFDFKSEVKTDDGKSVKVTAIGNFRNSIFIFGCQVDSSYGIYVLLQDVDQGGKVTFSFQKQLDVDSEVVSIAYRDNDSKLLFATANVLYSATFQDGHLATATVKQLLSMATRSIGTIKAVFYLDHTQDEMDLDNSIEIITSTGDMLVSSKGVILEEANVTRLQASTSREVNDWKKLNSEIELFATSNGVCYRTPTQGFTLVSGTSGIVKSLAVFNGEGWFGDSSGKLWKITVSGSSCSAQSYHSFSAAVVGVEYFNDIMIVATAAGLFFELNAGQKNFVEIKDGTNSVSCTAIKFQQVDSQTGCIYAGRASGKFAAFLVSSPTYTETDKVEDDLSTVFQASASGSIWKAYPINYYKRAELTSQRSFAIVNYGSGKNLSSDVIDLATKRKAITANDAHYSGMLIDYLSTDMSHDVSSHAYLFGADYCDQLSSFDGKNSDVLDRQDLDAQIAGWKINGGVKVKDDHFAINMTSCDLNGNEILSKLAFVHFDHRYTRKILQLSESSVLSGEVFKIGNVVYTATSKTGSTYNFGSFEPQASLKDAPIDSRDSMITSMYTTGSLKSVVDNGEIVRTVTFDFGTQYHFTRADYVVKDSNAYALSSYLSSGPFIHKGEVHDEGLVLVRSQLVNCGSGINDVILTDGPNQYASLLVPSSGSGLSVVMKRTSLDAQCFNVAKVNDPTCIFNLQGVGAKTTHGSTVRSAAIESIGNDVVVSESYALPKATKKITNQLTFVYSTGSAIYRAIDSLETQLTATTDGTKPTGAWSAESNAITKVSEQQVGSNVANALDLVRAGSFTYFRVGSQIWRISGNAVTKVADNTDIGTVQKLTVKQPTSGNYQLVLISSVAQRTYSVDQASGSVSVIDTKKFSIGSSTISTGFTIASSPDVEKRERFTVSILHSTDIGSSQEVYKVGNKLMVYENGSVLDPSSTNVMQAYRPTVYHVCDNDVWMTFAGNEMTVKPASGASAIDISVGRAVADFWPLKSSGEEYIALYKSSDTWWYVLANSAGTILKNYQVYQVKSIASSVLQAIRSSDAEPSLSKTSQVADPKFNWKHPLIVNSASVIGIPKYKIRKDVATSVKYSDAAHPGKEVSKIALVDGTKDALLLCKETASSTRAYKYQFSTNSVDPTSLTHDVICYPNNLAGALSQNCAIVTEMDGDNPINVGVMVDEAVTWLDKHDPSLANVTSATKFTHLAYTGGKYIAFFSTGAASYQISFVGVDSTGSSFQATSWSLQDPFIRFGSVLRISGNNYLIAVDNAVYNYTFERTKNELMDWGYQVKASSRIGALTSFTDSIQTTYLLADGANVLSSSNARTWGNQLSVGTTQNGKVLAYMQLGARNIVAGKSGSSDAGAYRSKYTYGTVNDTPVFTAEDAYSIYQEKQDEIGPSIQHAYDEHVTNMHGDGSSAKLLSEYTSRAFEISGFIQEPHTQRSVKNDYIERILTGDQRDDVMFVRVKNSALGPKKQASVDYSYIAKCWKSGIIELFIYIPTTHTYYIPHIKYAGFCSAQDNVAVAVNNRMLSANIEDNYTTIDVGILSSYFFFDAIFENTIKGNSLPLRIYRDNVNYDAEEGLASHLFHSFIEPSVASDIDLTSAKFENYVARYFSFGSDAQAIKITGYDSQRNYLKKYKTVVYHGMGGKNLETDLDVMSIRLLEGAPAKRIYWEVFKQEGAIFLGWSPSKQKTDIPDLNYGESKQFTYETLDQMTLHLYACWTFYQFSNEDTQITIDNVGHQDYTISEVTIDPNITFANNPALEDKIIVDFGED